MNFFDEKVAQKNDKTVVRKKTVSKCFPKKTAQKFCTNDKLKKRNQRTREVKSLSESCRTEMLPKTPLKIVIVRKAYQNARQKVSITKTVQKTAKNSLSEESLFEFLVKKYMQRCRLELWRKGAPGKRLY